MSQFRKMLTVGLIAVSFMEVVGEAVKLTIQIGIEKKVFLVTSCKVVHKL